MLRLLGPKRRDKISIMLLSSKKQTQSNLIIPFLAATMRFAPHVLAENQSFLCRDCVNENDMV